jgi:hypothetical protein
VRFSCQKVSTLPWSRSLVSSTTKTHTAHCRTHEVVILRVLTAVWSYEDTESDHEDHEDHSSIHATWHQLQIARSMVQLICGHRWNQRQPCQTPHACTRADAAVLIRVLGPDNERPCLLLAMSLWVNSRTLRLTLPPCGAPCHSTRATLRYRWTVRHSQYVAC